jgi:Leucine-rich repeat (LRR) protein
MARATKVPGPDQPPPWSFEAALRDPRRQTEVVVCEGDVAEFLRVCDRFPNLRKLELQLGGVRRLPRKFFDLVRLRELALGGYFRLDSLPEAVGKLQNLETLVLTENELRRLPKAIGQLARLKVLRLAGNALERVPRELFRCTALRVLELQGNRLKVLPSEIGLLTKLEELWVNANALRRCPPEVGRLRRLRILSLNRNQFAEIPEAIGRLKRLKELWVGENPLSDRSWAWLRSTFPAEVLFDLEMDLEEFRRALERVGRRFTPERLVVYRCLTAETSRLTTEEIYAAALLENPSITPDTVAGALDALMRAHLVAKWIIKGELLRYSGGRGVRG